jgi:hypothetical protein
MNGDIPAKRFSMTLPNSKSGGFAIMPICGPTTPSSTKTQKLDGDILDVSFDSYEFEEHDISPVKINKEVGVEEMFRMTLPISLVSQKAPSLNFSLSSNDSDLDFKYKNYPKIKIIPRKMMKKKDYKIGIKDRPLNSTKLENIIFNQVIPSSNYKCS